MPFTLRDVPTAMRLEKFGIGARLMDRWLEGAGWTMPDKVKAGDQPAPAWAVDEDIVTMKWALSFGRAFAAHRALLDTWNSPRRLAATSRRLREQLGRWIDRLPANATAKPFRFGRLGGRTRDIDDHSQINREHVDSAWYGTIDDFYAALGSALFKVAATRMVERDGSSWRITIDQLGTYVRDTYDFNGDQPLGSWGPTGFSRMAVLAPAIEVDYRKPASMWMRVHNEYTVNNKSFRDYRDLFNRGRDFVVYSDVLKTTLTSPIMVTVPA